MGDATGGRVQKRVDAERNRKAILKASISQFRKHGINASLEEMAREAGVGIGTLYRNFPTRESIVAAALEHQNDLLLIKAKEVRKVKDPIVGLAAWIAALYDYLRTFKGLPEPMLTALEGKGSPLSVTCDCMLFITDELLKRAADQGTVRQGATAKSLFQCVLGTSWALGYSDSDAQAEADVLMILQNGYRSAVGTK